MRVSLNVDHLRGALQCTDKKDKRLYINGVNILHDPEHGVVYYAGTCGSILYRGYENSALCFDNAVKGPQAFNITIPIDALAKALPKDKNTKRIDLFLQGIDSNYIGDVEFIGIDATFPDISRIIPKRTSGEYGVLDITLVTRAARALGLGPKNTTGLLIHYNGLKDPAICSTVRRPHAIVLVMPYRAPMQINIPYAPDVIMCGKGF